ncbi:hypothetical protein CHS0354_012778 [Potamilus streckersoni]|uniref:C1q domain-containing protein n=1 Tax=Potamilus streckersoni TaxID=2493646 RepID=A0AAE0RVD6_9BIVA|nr:hypothetical protein CHS0354_012778 [Potamilus streckersoni]
MHIFLVLVSAFGALGVAITHSALNSRDDDGETDGFDRSLHDLLSRIEAIMFDDDTLRTRLSDLEKEIKRQTEFRQVAFDSTISVEDLTNLGVHHTIIFDHVITNIGGAYHPHTGVFITPIDGVYVFNLRAVARARTWEWLELVKDGSWIQSILADAGSFDSFATGSLVAVLELNKGNEVWVRTGGGTGEIHGSSYTFFSAWLLIMK